jgi:GT2 family glycosyltransferase
MNEEGQYLVSVLIISYNGRHYLEDCLNSVLDQDFPRQQYEVIVVDNASRDGSADFVEQNYPMVRLVRLDRNYGTCVAVSRARPHVRGKYLAYLNQDVVAHCRWLAELVDVITSHPQAGIVTSTMILPQWSGYEGRRREGLVDRAYVCDLTSLGVIDIRVVPVTSTTSPIEVLAAYGAGLILNPQILDELGYWLDPDFFAYFDDIDIGLRLNAAGYQVLLAPRSVVYHDTDWLFKWDRRSIRRVFWSTRNMFLGFYKLSYFSEFVVLFPRLVLGKMLKAGLRCRSFVCRVFYALAGTPLLFVSLIAALARFPAYRERRRLTLSRRKMERGWLVDRLLSIDWQPDPTIWDDRKKDEHHG